MVQHVIINETPFNVSQMVITEITQMQAANDVSGYGFKILQPRTPGSKLMVSAYSMVYPTHKEALEVMKQMVLGIANGGAFFYI